MRSGIAILACVARFAPQPSQNRIGQEAPHAIKEGRSWTVTAKGLVNIAPAIELDQGKDKQNPHYKLAVNHWLFLGLPVLSAP